MVAGRIVFLFISFFRATFSSTFKETIDSKNVKNVAETRFEALKIWTEYSELLAVDHEDSFCSQNADIVFSDNFSKNIYYRCQNGKRELYQCIEGFEFDDESYRCMPKEWFAGKKELDECIFEMDGFYPDFKTNCQDYFRCENGLKVETFSCPRHEAFSFHLQSCQSKREVTCAQSKCHVTNDDFFIFPGSKCLAYYQCQGGFRTDFLCPKGATFDIQTKTCVENGICYEPVCTGRIDGTYADTTHNCARSFACKGGMLEEVKSCPLGQKYNGHSCVSSRSHKCEKPQKTAAFFYIRPEDECKDYQDGSHLIPGTDCKSVRVCFRGKTVTAFECFKDERYDGNRCLPKEKVPCDEVCATKSDGYYPDEFTDCLGYYRCSNGKVVRRKRCPSGTAFDGQFCVPAHMVSCPKASKSITRKCLGLRDGFHPDYLTGCKNYFYCHNHEMVLSGSCSDGFTYNGKKCVKGNPIMCEGPREMEQCVGLPPGLHQNKTSGCTKYFYCSNGSGTELSCPPGLIFNGYKCLSTDEYTCSNPDSCDGEPDGYKQDKTTACRSYYYCSKGNKITYVCPDKFVFNGSLCVSKDSYQCPFRPSKDCQEKKDGYHPDEESNCKDYYYCLKGDKLNTLTCGGKKIFNGRGCVLTDEPESACQSFLKNPCRSKEDGIYAEVESDCRKYFSCRNRTMTNENWCPKGSAFNGRICLRNFACSAKGGESTCEGKPIGFYQDLSTQCRSYYFCLFNTKTIGICPKGTIFNGQLCIDSNYYKCPRIET